MTRFVALVLFLFLAAPASAGRSPDLTRLKIGDGKVVYDGPKRGHVYACSQPNGISPGVPGPWISGSFWNYRTKPLVDGSVFWETASFGVRRNGSRRVIRGNGLPSHNTGVYPIAASDDAYQYDRNPNSISAQSVSLSFPAVPQKAGRASCTSLGMVGALNSGAAVFNALDAGGKDAPAHEIQDRCDGHPERSGQYHYHALPRCLATGSKKKHSRRIGWALDGFPIYGPRGKGGEYMRNRDLDACHGHTHTIGIDAERRRLFHYHATMEYPYTLACYRGTPVSR